MNKYKKIETRIRKTVNAIRNGENSLYDVAKDCLALSGDSAAYADAIGIDESDVCGHIEGLFLADFNVTLPELKAIMGAFPSREQWDKPLAALYGEAAAMVQQERSQEREHATQKRRRVKRSEFEQVAQQRDEAQSELKHSRNMVGEMQARIRELEQENAVLRGRIQELERLLSRETVAA